MHSLLRKCLTWIKFGHPFFPPPPPTPSLSVGRIYKKVTVDTNQFYFHGIKRICLKLPQWSHGTSLRPVMTISKKERSRRWWEMRRVRGPKAARCILETLEYGREQCWWYCMVESASCSRQGSRLRYMHFVWCTYCSETINIVIRRQQMIMCRCWSYRGDAGCIESHTANTKRERMKTVYDLSITCMLFLRLGWW